MLLFYLGAVVAELSLFMLPAVRTDVRRLLAPGRRIAFLLVFVSVVFGFSGDVLFFAAIMHGPITLVSAFVDFQSLFVLLFTTMLSIHYPIFLKEAIDRKTFGIKLLAILLLSVGLVLLAV